MNICMVKDKRTDEEIQADEEKKILADEDRIKRLTEATESADKASARLLELETRVKMGGRATQAPPEPPKVISDEEYAKAALKGVILK